MAREPPESQAGWNPRSGCVGSFQSSQKASSLDAAITAVTGRVQPSGSRCCCSRATHRVRVPGLPESGCGAHGTAPQPLRSRSGCGCRRQHRQAVAVYTAGELPGHPAGAIPHERHQRHQEMVKQPKLLLTDTGLCAYLTEWSSPRPSRRAPCPEISWRPTSS